MKISCRSSSGCEASWISIIKNLQFEKTVVKISKDISLMKLL